MRRFSNYSFPKRGEPVPQPIPHTPVAASRPAHYGGGPLFAGGPALNVLEDGNHKGDEMTIRKVGDNLHSRKDIRSSRAIMAGLIFISAVLCWMLTVSIASSQEPEKEKAAIAAAEKWLGLIDDGKYAESWTDAAGYFRNAVTQGDWAQKLQAVRNPLGKLISREVKNRSYHTSLPGVPDGEYVVLQFETSFENRKSAMETVTPMLDKDGKWRVSGYFIK